MIDREGPILVLGGTGLVGSAVLRRLEREGFGRILAPMRHELDLMDAQAVRTFFDRNRPRYCVLAAARVGGILANSTLPADFIRDNLQIQMSVLVAAHESRTEKLAFLGSSCIYPRSAPQPIRETDLFSGPLEPTNSAYAVAKIAGIAMCQAYWKQYGDQFISLMPTNLYGPHDNFDLETSHVLPALLRRFHEAKVSGRGEVVVWGTGRPRREFMHADDLADAILFLMDRYESPEVINVGTGRDVSISELAEIVRAVVGYQGVVRWDSSRPDGTPRKLLDVSRLSELGWKASVDVLDGIRSTYSWFVRNSAGNGDQVNIAV
jgi:GDP-L-fucose synthase